VRKQNKVVADTTNRAMTVTVKRVDPPADEARNGIEKKPKLGNTDGADDYWTKLCDEIKQLVVSDITPAKKAPPDVFVENMTYAEIEALYSIHKEPYVRIKVTGLKLFEHFRCIQYKSSDYQKVMESFKVCSYMILESMFRNWV